MLLISDREHFWNTQTLSQKTQWAEVSNNPSPYCPEQVNQTLQSLEEKVLLFIHGFDNTGQEVISKYILIASNMQKFVIDETKKPFYDAIIGYVWPGFNLFVEYYLAKRNAKSCAPRLKKILEQISTVAHLDVIAHSMGNRVLLEALRCPKDSFKNYPLSTFFSVAAAINDRRIDPDSLFYQSTTNMKEMDIFFSLNDPVERWFYPIAERAEALGYEGDGNPSLLPGNIQTIDCSSIIHSHSGYFSTPSVYDWIRKKKMGEIDGPRIIQDMTLASDGSITVKRWRTQVATPQFERSV